MTHDNDSTNPSPFRSRLEQDIADELDALDIDWEYERPVVLPDGTSLRYLPDFSIGDFNEWMHPGPLPKWIEGKPQQFIYDLRDSLGVTRRYGDRFEGTVDVPGVDSEQLRQRHIEELWKPKRLAEITGQVVLVVGGVGGMNRLSCEMHADRITFCRDNWIVNYKGHEMRQEREQRRRESAAAAARWRAEQEERERQYEQQRDAAEAERRAGRGRELKVIMSYLPTGANRHAGRCPGCDAHVEPQMGQLRCVPLTGGGSRWFVVCATCEVTHS